LITAPVGVSKLLTELCEQVGILLFWDEVNEELILKSVRPNSVSETVTDLTADYHLLADSLKLKDLNDERVNEAWIYYGLIDFTKNLEEESNYKLLYVGANVSDQSTNKNRDVRIKKIFSRWITETASSAARDLSQKYLERYAVAPIEANFNLDAKDGSLALADFVRINSRQYQDFYGNNQDLLLQIVKRKEALVGTTWAFTARQFAFSSNANPNRIVDIAVDTWDLDLKAAHDEHYSPAKSGDVVIVTIKAGVLVSASTTSLYALTNPNTWAAGVIINLIIESGAIVCGLGGSGGDGGIFPTFFTYTDAQDGENGGNAVFVNYALSINNLGIIGGGGGGGGGDAGESITSGVTTYYNGSGGGGGAALGAAGLGSVGGVGVSGVDGSVAMDTTGGVGGTIGALHGVGGTGGNLGADGTDGDDGVNGAFTYYGGTGGLAGDCIHGNSYITWVATGTRYGAIV
jgi:hypothetical protein